MFKTKLRKWCTCLQPNTWHCLAKKTKSETSIRELYLDKEFTELKHQMHDLRNQVKQLKLIVQQQNDIHDDNITITDITDQEKHKDAEITLAPDSPIVKEPTKDWVLT